MLELCFFFKSGFIYIVKVGEIGLIYKYLLEDIVLMEGLGKIFYWWDNWFIKKLSFLNMLLLRNKIFD